MRKVIFLDSYDKMLEKKIKALDGIEKCTQLDIDMACKACPYYSLVGGKCINTMLKDAADVIVWLDMERQRLASFDP